MTEESTHIIWLTQEAFDKLREEYEHLTTVGREEVTGRIAAARAEGDLSENGGYHAAREEQGQMEARILQLKDVLNNARVGVAPDSGEIAPGQQITIAFDGDPDDTETFLLGSREVLGLDESVDTPVYSPQSPLGAAILGHHQGDEVTYTPPTGRPITVVITAVQPHTT